MNVLVTGGAGYIGSHTLIELLNSHHNVTVVDDLSNSSRESLARVETITGQSVPFYQFDLRDDKQLNSLFERNKFDAVIHFAGLKSVGESVANPLKYYSVNIESTLRLLDAMKKFSCFKLLFSSSATVYGTPAVLPITEEYPVGVGITNPYGQTKYMIEQIIRDHVLSEPNFEATILRYFNPVGAHESGLIGEDPNGVPNNLLPYIAQVAVGKLEKVSVFGNDYDTLDGTGVRDYIHVVDLAEGHVAALDQSVPGANIYNLGTGKGTSVLELIAEFSQVVGKNIPHEIKPRRAGDIASSYCDSSKANSELHWKAEKSIKDACVDSWRWQSRNPNGYNI